MIAQTALVRQLQARSVPRYLAPTGDIARGSRDAPIGRHPVKRTSVAVVATGKPSVTLRVRERWATTRCSPTASSPDAHQIRVHLASSATARGRPATAGHAANIAFGRQALRAWKLGLEHPSTGEPMRWDAPLPSDFGVASLRQREPAMHVR
jgi:23S rRNA pseudouridine1911/1915/1917 synthase